jgi:hypothetical protein
MSKSKQGKIRPHSENTKRKIGLSNKGKKPTEETREKMSKKAKERFDIPENHPRWRGGISCEPYCEAWTDKEYKHWIKYERDGGKCQNPACSFSHSGRIVLHHINYIKKDCHPINLITLCISCNSRANKDRDWHQAWYTEIMRRK